MMLSNTTNMRVSLLQLLCLAFLMACASSFTVSPSTTTLSPLSSATHITTGSVRLQLHPNQGDILLKESAKEHQLKPADAASASKPRRQATPPTNVLAWCRKVFGTQKTKENAACAKPTE
jgi:hypothetical protein